MRIAGLGEISGAAEAGLGKGDVIRALDGQPTRSFIDIKLLLMDRKPGDRVQLRYLPKGEPDNSAEKETTVLLR